MTTTTLTKAAVILVGTGTLCAPGVTTRGAADMRGSLGGLLTLKLRNNGALGAQATVNVLIAHSSDPTPAAAAAGDTWKTVYSVGGGTANFLTTEWTYRVPPEAMHVAVEMGGTHTTNTVSCEAMLSKISAAESV